MNVHHLELFFYVAKYEGITQAVRKMPYGIQQPAVSGQMLQLERDLGVKLFNRRPFNLTPAGEELYDYCYPFFSKLAHIGAKLKGEESQHLRLAASAAVLTNHIPPLLDAMKTKYPKLRLTLRDVVPGDVDGMLQSQEVDLAISLMHGKTGAGVKKIDLLRLPIVLLVPETSPVKSFRGLNEEFGVISDPLITLPGHEILSKIFHAELQSRGLRWEPRVEVNSLEIIASYVQKGFGYGISADVPGGALPSGVRKIKLTKFPPLVVGVLHSGKLNPVAADFLALTRDRATKIAASNKG